MQILRLQVLIVFERLRGQSAFSHGHLAGLPYKQMNSEGAVSCVKLIQIVSTVLLRRMGQQESNHKWLCHDHDSLFPVLCPADDSG